MTQRFYLWLARTQAAYLWWTYRRYMGSRPSHRYSTYEADMLKYRAMNATRRVAAMQGENVQ